MSPSTTSRLAVHPLKIAIVLTMGMLVTGCGNQEPPRSLSTTDPGPLTRATPLDPKQILEGNPLTHTTDVYQSGDGNLFVAYWSASAGRFTWDYKDINEVITILEGEAFVKTSDGTIHHLKPGMTLTFGAGDYAEWHVPKYIRKVAVVQNSPRPFLRRVRDKLAKLLGS
jgi:uncharacterized cupin superfamily protein